MNREKGAADLLFETQQALAEFSGTSKELKELRALHYSLIEEKRKALDQLWELQTAVTKTLDQIRDLEEKTQGHCQALADRVELARLQFAELVREAKAQTGLELEKQEEKIQRLGGDLSQLDQALGKLLKKQRELEAKLNWLLVAVAGLAGVLTMALIILRP